MSSSLQRSAFSRKLWIIVTASALLQHQADSLRSAPPPRVPPAPSSCRDKTLLPSASAFLADFWVFFSTPRLQLIISSFPRLPSLRLHLPSQPPRHSFAPPPLLLFVSSTRRLIHSSPLLCLFFCFFSLLEEIQLQVVFFFPLRRFFKYDCFFTFRSFFILLLLIIYSRRSSHFHHQRTNSLPVRHIILPAVTASRSPFHTHTHTHKTQQWLNSVSQITRRHGNCAANTLQRERRARRGGKKRSEELRETV